MKNFTAPKLFLFKLLLGCGLCFLAANRVYAETNSNAPSAHKVESVDQSSSLQSNPSWISKKWSPYTGFLNPEPFKKGMLKTRKYFIERKKIYYRNGETLQSSQDPSQSEVESKQNTRNSVIPGIKPVQELNSNSTFRLPQEDSFLNLFERKSRKTIQDIIRHYSPPQEEGARPSITEAQKKILIKPIEIKEKLNLQLNQEAPSKVKSNKPSSCHNISNTGRDLKIDISSSEVLLAERCLSNRNDRSFACIHWMTKQAVEAFSTEPACKERITVKKMMCIFKQEVTLYDRVPCNRNGCGLSQMTSEGANTVKRGVSIFNLGVEYDSFWDMVGRPDQKRNKCVLTRKSALDRDTSIIMAATHLCAQAKHNKKASSAFLNCEFQKGYNYCRRSGGNSAYSRSVDNCEKKDTWKLVEEQMRIADCAKARKEGRSCPSLKTPQMWSDASSSSKGGAR